MDRFLLFLNENDNYSRFMDQFSTYGGCFPKEEFFEKHFLEGDLGYIRNGIIYEYSRKSDPEELIEEMTALIRARAKAISENRNMCDKLFHWFVALKGSKPKKESADV